MCRGLEGARAVGGQAECLVDQILADVFGLESGVTTEVLSSLVVNYDHIISITKNTQLLYMLFCSYWLPNSDITEISHNMTIIAFYLNYTRGL